MKMKRHKNRIVAGIILGLILISVAPAMAEDITLRTQNTVQAGTILTARWTYNGSFEPNVTVELIKSGILNRTIVSDTYIGNIFYYNEGIPYGEGVYDYWAVPVSLEAGMYQIKIIGNTTAGLEVTNTSDLEITSATTDGCKLCHTDPLDIHHSIVGGNEYYGTTLGCPDCHPSVSTPGGEVQIYERNCLNCHNGTAFWANPLVVNPGEPHVNNSPPVINSVTLSNNTPNTGDLILITVNVTDQSLVWESQNSVMANDVSLTLQSGYGWNNNYFWIWTGSITAIEGTHSVNVSANDGLGHVTWDNSTSYTATTLTPTPTPTPTPNIIVTSPMTGDNWIRGTTQTIRWTYTGDLGSSATVELLEQGRVDQTWTNVPQANGVGSLDWAIPSQFEVSTYQVRVSAGGLSNTTGNFSIVKR